MAESELDWTGLMVSAALPRVQKAMPAFLYRCPTTGFKVQGYSAEETSDENAYDPVTCIMCRRVHLVNPATGKVLGESDE